jgi:hypothetical protein
MMMLWTEVSAAGKKHADGNFVLKVLPLYLLSLPRGCLRINRKKQ